MQSHLNELKDMDPELDKMITKIEKADQEAFEWAAYILWENNILVASGDEDPSWYTMKKK